MPAKLWSYQDLELNCLFPNMSDLWGVSICERWFRIFFFQVTFLRVTVCGAVGKKLDSKGIQIWAHPQAFKRDALEEARFLVKGSTGNLQMTAIKSISECIAPGWCPSERGAKPEFSRPTWSQIGEAGTAHRLLAKARGRTLCQWEEQSKTVAVKSMVSGAIVYGPLPQESCDLGQVIQLANVSMFFLC